MNSVRALGVLAACLSVLAPARATTPDRHITQYGHRAWRYEDNAIGGRPPNSLTQTADGYLWLGGDGGLWRFDGVRFTAPTFPPGESLPSTRVNRLLSARDGSLWIGTTHGPARLYGGHLTVYRDVSEAVSALAEAPDGAIWLGLWGPSKHGPLCRLGSGELRCFGPEDGLRIAEVQSLLVTGTGEVWLGSDVALQRWTPGSPGAVYEFPGMQSNSGQLGVTAIEQGRDGSIWVSNCSNDPAPRLVKIVDGVDHNYQAKNLDLRAIQCARLYQDGAGTLWLGTREEGLYRIHEGTAEHFGVADGLTGGTVEAIFEDREGTLWVVTNNGLDSFFDTRVVRFTRTQGLASLEIDGVQSTRPHAVYISTAQGLDVLDTRDDSVRLDTRLSRSQIAATLEDHEGRLWVGVDDDLLLEDRGKVSRIAAPNGQSLGMVFELAEDGAGDLWATAMKGSDRALVWIHDGRVKNLFPPEQVPISRSVAGDPRGGVWLGLRDGNLAHFDGQKLDTFLYPHDDKAEGRRIVVTDDNTVIGATSYGLIGLRDGVKRVLDVEHGLPCRHLFGVAFDRPGDLWIAAECGVIEVPADQYRDWWNNPEKGLSVRLLDSADGLQSGLAPFGSATRSADGRLWFANGTAIELIDPSHLSGNAVPPPVHIEQLSADHIAYAAEEGVRLPALTRDIEIDYTALSLVAPEKVRFRYRLEGRDRDWVDAGHRRQAFYNDLAPGTYTFRVLASNNDDVWNLTGAAESFTIRPAFYQTLSFRVALGVLVICAFWFLYCQRLRSATTQMQARLEERLLERERIARELHDTLLQGFQGLVLRFHAVLKQLSNPDAARSMLEGALDRAEDVLRESRARLAELRPDEMDTRELSEVLSQFGRSFEHPSSPAFRLTLEGTPRELTPTTQLALIRIGREAIANAFLHAKARNISAAVVYGPSGLELRVTDDGTGIPPAIIESGLPGHFGLAHLREDAARIGAHLVIHNNDGRGTTVELNIGARQVYARSATGARWARGWRPG